jgi:hypothetical protein
VRSSTQPPPTVETDWLDFKQQPSTDLKHTKWREMWVEALAGFANNQGGVIIWGIDARKDPATNVDAACAETPVANPNGVKSRLIELQRQPTDPPLANVEIEAYEIPSAPGTGFVVCFVPEGPFKPYRTEDGRKSQFLIRAGDNFVVMSRSMLQSMFYPRSQALFETRGALSFRIVGQGEPRTGDARFMCEVFLRNRGTATAKDPLVRVRGMLKDACRISSTPGPSWYGPPGDSSGLELRSAQSIHPADEVQLAEYRWYESTSTSALTGGRIVPFSRQVPLELTIYAEGQEPQQVTLTFDVERMVTAKVTETELRETAQPCKERDEARTRLAGRAVLSRLALSSTTRRGVEAEALGNV